MKGRLSLCMGTAVSVYVGGVTACVLMPVLVPVHVCAFVLVLHVTACIQRL